MASVRDREDWIANRPGFWDAVGEAQDDLGIPRLGPWPPDHPVSLPTLEYLRDQRRWQRAAKWLAGRPETDQSGDGDGADGEGRGALTASESWHQRVGLWASAIVTRLGLLESDTMFVASCVVLGIRFYLRDRYIADPVTPIALYPPSPWGDTWTPEQWARFFVQTFSPRRIYLDVTESLDIGADVQARGIDGRSILDRIEELRRDLGVHPSRRSRPGSGQPAKGAIVAYARLLRSRTTWPEIAEEINGLFPGQGFTGESLRKLVDRTEGGQGGATARNPPE